MTAGQSLLTEQVGPADGAIPTPPWGSPVRRVRPARPDLANVTVTVTPRLQAIRKPPRRRPVVRLWLLWVVLVSAVYAWRIWLVVSLPPASFSQPDAPNHELIDFGFTHLPYWLAGIVAALVLQFVLLRRWWDEALTRRPRQGGPD